MTRRLGFPGEPSRRWVLLLAILVGACQAASPEVGDRAAEAGLGAAHSQSGAPPTPEHAWLAQLVGDWQSTAEVAQPGSESVQLAGRESVRAIGDLWVVSDVEGQMPGGGRMLAVMTVGFDEKRQRFVGTWVDSALNHMWRYDGSLDASRKILTLESEGPDSTDPAKVARFRDAITVVDQNHRLLRSSILGPDGKWTVFLTVHYTRKR